MACSRQRRRPRRSPGQGASAETLIRGAGDRSTGLLRGVGRPLVQDANIGKGCSSHPICNMIPQSPHCLRLSRGNGPRLDLQIIRVAQTSRSYVRRHLGTLIGGAECLVARVPRARCTMARGLLFHELQPEGRDSTRLCSSCAGPADFIFVRTWGATSTSPTRFASPARLYSRRLADGGEGYRPTGWRLLVRAYSRLL